MPAPRGIGSGRGLRERARDDRARRAASSRPSRARSGSAVRCCRSPTSAASSSWRAGLRELDVEIVSTGGSARELAEAGIEVRAIEDFTGFPEIMDGRVKTLNPRLYAGLLARRDDESHLREAAAQDDRAGRPRVREPLPLRADRRPRRCDRAGGDREHRHRRPDDDPRRRQEQRLRRGAHRPGRLRAGAGRAARERRAPQPRDPPPARRRRLRDHGPLRRRDLGLVRRARNGRRRAARVLRRVLREGDGSPLRREPAPERRLLRARRRADAPARRRRASSTARSCRSTTCSTSASARELVEEFDRPACAIVKHNNPCGCAVGDDVHAGLRARLRMRPAERLRRRDRAQPARRRRRPPSSSASSSSRCCSRPATSPRRWRCCRRRRTCACSSCRTGRRRRASSKASPCWAGGSCRAATSSRRPASRCR